MLHSYSRTRTKRFLYLFNKTIPSNAASEPKTEREETSIWIDTQKNEGKNPMWSTTTQMVLKVLSSMRIDTLQAKHKFFSKSIKMSLLHINSRVWVCKHSFQYIFLSSLELCHSINCALGICIYSANRWRRWSRIVNQGIDFKSCHINQFQILTGNRQSN